MNEILKELGLEEKNSGTFNGSWLLDDNPTWITSYSPIDGSAIADVAVTTPAQYDEVVAAASEDFQRFRQLPAPKRGEIIRLCAEEFRRLKEPLGKLITLEMGKIAAEGGGEVQEVIDIADFAVGLSRQLYGKTMHSERANHRMYEQWHPLGNVGCITAFNFPAAVWAWNAMIAAACGDTVVWKPSELTPLTAVAVTNIVQAIARDQGFPALFTLICDADASLGKKMAADRRFPLISATGSCAMGRNVGEVVAARLGRSLLELGGNNAIVVLDDADLDLAIRGVLFGAVGTAGQRCTTTRRVFLQKGIKAEFTKRLVAAYEQVPIGNPLEDGTLMGPLVHQRAIDDYTKALERISKESGEILCGGEVLSNMPSELYVKPTVVAAKRDMSILQEEIFVPIVYLIEIGDLDDAIALHNNVPQGLSSAIFTSNVRAAEQFLSAIGSDCGIANVNIGTSGAEIGGAFGGEKDTGGGREAGSDSWKAYMRRQTTTINWGTDLPLAQGIEFG